MRTALESVHLVAATIGFLSFTSLWAGTLMGSVLRSGWASSRLRHSTVHGIHMHLVLLGLWLGVVHGVVQLAAPGGKVRVIDLVIPFLDRADPIGVGFGVLALELLLASALSVLVQRRMGWHRWRALHSLGYLAFTLVAAHLLISGAEVAAAPVRAAVALAWAAVAVTGAATIAPVARLPRALLERVARRHRAEEITVAVDAGRCASFGFCEQEAPAIFTLRSDRRLAYRSMVSSDQAEAATRAAVVCPARAITLGRLPTAVVLAQPADEIVEPAGEVPVAASLAPTFQPPAGPRKAGSARRPAEPVPARDPEPRRTGPGSEPRRTGPVRGPAESAPVPVAALREALAREPAQLRRPGPGPEPRRGAPVRGPAESAPVPVAALREALGRPGPQGPAGPQGPRRAAPGPDPRRAGPVRGPAESAPVPVAALRAAVQRGSVDPHGAATAPRGVPAARGPEALPPPSDMQDTGRHHLPPLRGLPGGRSGSGR